VSYATEPHKYILLKEGIKRIFCCFNFTTKNLLRH
jgi:hypothetical protein